MTRFFGPLPVAGDGTFENGYQPDVPPGVKDKIDDLVAWGAWYYPDKPPYKFCIITVWKEYKKLPEAVNKLELTPEQIKTEYPTLYDSLIRTKQIMATALNGGNPDPAPESWDFEDGTVGQIPVGWTDRQGETDVANDQVHGGTKSAKATFGTTQCTAGAARTDFRMDCYTRVSGAVEGSDTAWGTLQRWQSTNNWYHSILNLQDPIGVRLSKYVNAVYTIIATTSWSISLNTWYGVRTIMNGWDCQIWIDSGAGYVQALPATGWQDLTGHDLSSGIIGIRRFHFLVSNWWDDVSVEDLVPSAFGVTPIPAAKVLLGL